MTSTYLSLHVHNHYRIAAITDNELFGVFRQEMNTIHGYIGAAEGFERCCAFARFHTPQFHRPHLSWHYSKEKETVIFPPFPSQGTNVMTWWPSVVKMALFTNEMCPRNSLITFPDFSPWILAREIAGQQARTIELRSYRAKWSNEPLNSWVLSLEKVKLVTPFWCAPSNFRRHWPVCTFHTWSKRTR